jgi:hypothetical protein
MLLELALELLELAMPISTVDMVLLELAMLISCYLEPSAQMA